MRCRQVDDAVDIGLVGEVVGVNPKVIESLDAATSSR